MAQVVKTDITLRTARGVAGLALTEIGDDSLLVEGEHAFRPDQVLEFQFALPSANANLWGRARVRRVLRLAVGPTRTELAIVEMGRDQRGILREWLAAQAAPAPAPRAAPTVEAIRRAGPGNPVSDVATTPPPTSGRTGSVVSSITETHRPRGRAAVAGTMKGFPKANGEERPAPRRPATEPRAAPAPRALRRVEVKLAHAAVPPILQVRYNDPERYREHYGKHLQHGTLNVRFDEAAPAVDTEVRVNLVLPGGAVIRCVGVVAAAAENGFSLRLDLDDAARALLRASAGVRGPAR